MGRILAFDYGQKRVGVAVTDELQMIAGPLDTIHSSLIFDFIAAYLSAEKVDCFVVGQAKTMGNQDSESSIFIEPFVKKLQKLYPDIPVKRIDERFTSRMASDAILFSGAKKKDRRDKALVDKVSAVIILQSYMEMRTFGNEH